MGTAGRDVFERDENRRVDNNDKQCRICASDVDETNRINIFADDARRKYLQSKIRKYLYILVSTEDKLPKMVCSTCVQKLEGVHRFATMAYRTQERLRMQIEHENESDELVISSQTNESNDGKKHFIGAYEKQQQKDRGLLHSILTKGGIEILTEKESEDTTAGLSEIDAGIREDSQSSVSNMEEMEVKVDPMIFLECDLEEQGPSDYSDESDSNEEKLKHKDDFSNLIIGSSTENRSSMMLGKRDEVRISTRGKDSSEEGKEMEESEEEEDEEDEEEDIGESTVLKPYECTICARSFISQIGLQNHLWSHLPRERRYSDPKPILRSQHVYSSNGVLHTHATENSAATGNFVCPICSKRISTKGNLKVHLETHRPKGKYGCDICGRIFKTQSNLFRHKEYHGGIQFPCNVCGRVYPTNSTLRAHSITHSDLRPHACPLCDKTFKRNQDLKFHINQHTGARPYQCPYCPKAFASSGNCFSHRKRMHPREVHRDRQRAADLMR